MPFQGSNPTANNQSGAYRLSSALGSTLSINDDVSIIFKLFRSAIKNYFRKKLGFWPIKGGGGGGLTEAQVFVEIFQNQICLGKWPEM